MLKGPLACFILSFNVCMAWSVNTHLRTYTHTRSYTLSRLISCCHWNATIILNTKWSEIVGLFIVITVHCGKKDTKLSGCGDVNLLLMPIETVLLVFVWVFTERRCEIILSTSLMSEHVCKCVQPNVRCVFAIFYSIYAIVYMIRCDIHTLTLSFSFSLYVQFDT